MDEESLLVNKLTPAEQWVYKNTQLIADKVLWSKNGSGIIPRDSYDENLEAEIITLLGYMPKIAKVEKVNEGILIVSR